MSTFGVLKKHVLRRICHHQLQIINISGFKKAITANFEIIFDDLCGMLRISENFCPENVCTYNRLILYSNPIFSLLFLLVVRRNEIRYEKWDETRQRWWARRFLGWIKTWFFLISATSTTSLYTSPPMKEWKAPFCCVKSDKLTSYWFVEDLKMCS